MCLVFYDRPCFSLIIIWLHDILNFCLKHLTTIKLHANAYKNIYLVIYVVIMSFEILLLLGLFCTTHRIVQKLPRFLLLEGRSMIKLRAYHKKWITQIDEDFLSTCTHFFSRWNPSNLEKTHDKAGDFFSVHEIKLWNIYIVASQLYTV